MRRRGGIFHALVGDPADKYRCPHSYRTSDVVSCDGKPSRTVMIARAPDATVFLSTSALIIGIFLTVVTAALASNLPARLEDLIHPLNRGDYNEWYRKAIRSVLFILII